MKRDGYNYTRRKVSKEEWDSFMKNNKIVHTHVLKMTEPSVKLYWTETYDDMSFGRFAVASRLEKSRSPYYENEEDDLYLHDYSEIEDVKTDG
jgi:hypothetical protein